MAEIVPSVKTGKRRDVNIIFRIFKLEKDKTCIVLSLTNGKREENVGRRRIYSGVAVWDVLERENFSLDF